ncbi:OmpH family outer membrane protein [uncultured Aliiroseovarius sp.]|uniref:OmpH family outer membrane protein n=1 Tax=uncultured Aliiroseovarius sp. TaxID=1658783 RepID=UPI00262CEA1A|nr:OmpH family outer membrane protein [uncultured Aliiroseovarius sp.]
MTKKTTSSSQSRLSSDQKVPRVNRGTFFQHVACIAALSAAMFGVTSPTVAAAQQQVVQSVSQIVTIDRQRLFSETAYGRRVLATVEVERARLAQETREAEAALAQEEMMLTEQRSSLDPTSFRALADAFDNKVNELRAEGQAREQEFVRVLEREQTAFFERIGPILGRMVRELGAVVILDRRAILLAAQNIDITDMAIRRIDQELGDGLSTPNAPADDSSDETPADASESPAPEGASNN